MSIEVNTARRPKFRRMDAESLRVIAEVGTAAGLGKGKRLRMDSGETVALARQLEYVLTETFDVEYVPPKLFEFVPLDGTVPAGAETFVWRSWDRVGTAQIISDYAMDLPRVDVLVNEEIRQVVDVGISYGYSHKELRSAAYAGVQLDPMKAEAARKANELAIDLLVSLGDAKTGLKGFLNHPNVPRQIVTNGDWLNPVTTPDEIIADLFQLENKVLVQTMGMHNADTMLLPIAHHAMLSQRPRSAQSDTTILEFFLKNSRSVKTIEPWYRLATSGPASAPMAVCYERNPGIVRAVVPVLFEQLPPQARNLELSTQCLSRVGGCVFYRPLGAVYGDGI